MTTETLLLELLARIHRDGGQHTRAHGIEKSVADADIVVSNLYADPTKTAENDLAIAHQSIEALLAIMDHEAVADKYRSMVDTGQRPYLVLLGKMNEDYLLSIMTQSPGRDENAPLH